MDKQKAIEELKTLGASDDVIKAIVGGDDADTDSRIAALEAKLEATEGKASGILSDKKKAQQRAEELQARLEELETKDLGEVEKMKLENQRLMSKLEAIEQAKTELEQTYNTEKRDYSLNKIGGQLKWLDSVPENLRKMTLQSEFADLQDLGDDTLVSQRVKSIAEKYSGLLASDAPSGAGARPGERTNIGNRPNIDQIKNTSLSEIAKNPSAYVQQAMQAMSEA